MNGHKSSSPAPVVSDMVQCQQAFAWLAKAIKKNWLRGNAIVIHTTESRVPYRAARKSAA